MTSNNKNSSITSTTTPEVRLVRLSQIIGNKKATPPIPPIIPVSASTWWTGVKSGRFPKPVKLSQNCTAWRMSDIVALIEQAGEEVAA